jgi:hypothetical protein
LLEHAIESEPAVSQYILELLDKRTQLTLALNVVPKRVVFWTTPYKQLYKDPKLFVQVNKTLRTIDLLVDDDADVPDSLKKRVDAGMRDAEIKNEALWKLYVFLSDSLFYSG